ncbi:MAG: DUF6569 family protein, partial [Kofleriaceae bacterium]
MHPAIRLFAIPLLAVGCQRAGADETSVPPKPIDQIALTEQQALLKPIQVDSLTLTPIVATDAGLPKQDLDVLTLDEGFQRKLVSIKEKEDESVNNLTLTNKAAKPLFMLAGEVIIGGKQDRIIGQNTIIAANATLEVPVFCVEHGRWDESSRTFTTGKALAHGRLRAQANFENQSEVWREVNEKNQKRKTTSSTDTYRGVATQQAAGGLGNEKAVNTALAKLEPRARERMIGYVVSLNGKIATIDVFDSPRLFKKLEGKLVRSYLTEAVDVVADKTITPPSVADVKAFMADADKAVAERSYENSASATVRRKGMKAAKSSVDYKSADYDEADTMKPSPKKPSVYKT